MSAGLERWSGYVRLAVVIAIPLAFNPWSRRVFEPEKAATLRVLALVLLGLWVVRLATPQSTGPRRDLRAIILPSLLLAGVYVAASAFSVSRSASLLGSYEWRQGALTFLACLLLFLSAALQASAKLNVSALLNGIEATSVVVAAYGLLQYAGLDPIPWQRAVEGRSFATLGHPNFLASYLLLTIPLAAARLVSARARCGQFLHVVVLLVETACLFVTYSRSAWLGLLVAAACFGWLTRPAAGGRRLRFLVGILAVAIVAFLAVAYWDPHGLFSRAASPLEPVHSLLRGKSATAAVRTLIWQGSLEALRSRPWLGYGPETFRLSFPRAYPTGLAMYGGVRAAGEHAHNEWLDWALNAGVLGLLAYLWLLTAVIRAGVRGVRDGPPEVRPLLAGLIAAAAGYVAQNQLSFGTVAPLAHFWLYMGLIVALSPAEQMPAIEKQAARATPSRALVRGLVAYAGIVLFVVGGLELRALASDVFARSADDAAAAGDLASAETGRQRAVLLSPQQPRFWEDLGMTYVDLAVTAKGEAGEKYFRSAEKALQRAVELSPLDPQLHLDRGRLFYAWGAFGRTDAWLEAIQAYHRASELSPRDPDLWCRWGRVHHAFGEYNRALEKYALAVTLDPLHSLGFTYEAEAHLALGQLPQAREAYERAEASAAEVDRRISKR